MEKYVIGLDYGTESCRAILVNVNNGDELAQSIYKYSNGVIDEILPQSNIKLEKDWALQDPNDYLTGLKTVIPNVLKESKINAMDVIGIGVDFTACTIMPTLNDGTPLCFLDKFKNNPHAWVKLWKHHAAQKQADIINKLALEQNETFLKYYGGKVSSEWSIPKILQIINESPDVYNATEQFMECGDWIVFKLTGIESQNACAAGYKGFWNHETGFPSTKFLKQLHNDIENVIQQKRKGNIIAPGKKVGTLLHSMAKELGLSPNVTVSAATIDAHAGVPGCGVGESNKMVMIMGTSSCQMIMTDKPYYFNGFAGLVKDGILPGYFGYEYGQSAVGDIFAWFIENCVPHYYAKEAEKNKMSLHDILTEKAEKILPEESGLVALDWHNGNRSVLMNANLKGMMMGFSLKTKPEEMYRALIEATAFGTRKIIETHENNSMPIQEIYACGGLTKNKMLMQIYADVIGKEIKIATSNQPVALGAAIFGALAAGKSNGGYDCPKEAVSKMVKPVEKSFKPNNSFVNIYNNIYKKYLTLHDIFANI